MSEIDLELLQCFCDEAVDSLTEWESICLSLDQDHSNDVLNRLFRFAHNIKGASRAVGLGALGEFVHKIEDVITAVRDQSLPYETGHGVLFLDAQAVLLTWISKIRTDSGALVETTKLIQRADAFLTGEKTSSAPSENVPSQEIESKEEERAPSEPLVVAREATPSAPVTPKTGSQTASPAMDETVRVSANRLDHLIQVIGELSIHQAILSHARTLNAQDREKVYSESINMGKKLTKELYEKALGLRMQPVQPLFQRLERNIKDLARDLNKKVQVVCTGTEVELDKTVLEKIIDPLIHIVRNSVDHGIEPEDQVQNRIEKGKPAIGTVRLTAQQDSEGVVITVEDDGKGLARERILKKALEKGLIKDGDELTDDEVYNLIFLPGFSTAEKVTNVSGRGVGMDVVLKAVEGLSGKVSISSKEGAGSKFTVQLPTSLSILEALIVEVEDANYAVPINQIEEIINRSEAQMGEDSRMLSLRNRVIPYRGLSEFIPKQGQKAKTGVSEVILIVRSGRELLSFGVQKIIGQQQIVVRHLKGGLGRIFGFSGGTILATGEPGLILDLNAISEKHLKSIERMAS